MRRRRQRRIRGGYCRRSVSVLLLAKQYVVSSSFNDKDSNDNEENMDNGEETVERMY